MNGNITVPQDENLVKVKKDKQFQYLELAREVVDMWDVSTAVIVPIVVSANGLIANSLDEHLRKLSLGSWIKGLIQKAVLLDTARIVRKFLSQKPLFRLVPSHNPFPNYVGVGFQSNRAEYQYFT